MALQNSMMLFVCSHKEIIDQICTIIWLNALILLSRDCSCYLSTIPFSTIILHSSDFPQKYFAWVTNLWNLCGVHFEICSHKRNRGSRNLLPVPLEHWYSQSDADCTSVLSDLWEISVFSKIFNLLFPLSFHVIFEGKFDNKTIK